MKKSELREMIREEILKESYASKELMNISKTHDWDTYKISAVFRNSKGKKTKTLNLNKEIFNKILELV